MRTRFTVMALLLIVTTGPALAQQHGGGVFSKPEIEMLSDGETVTVPFELINNHLIIPLTVDGETFDVILDTGMPVSSVMLYDTGRIDKLDLDFAEMQVGVAGAGGGGKPVSARLAMGETVDVGSVRLGNLSMIVMPPMPGMAMYHEGVIGAALFENFVVGIDYDNRKLHLHDPETYEAANDAVSVPLTIGGPRRVPYASLAVGTANGERDDLRVVVDLGASHTLSLNTDSLERFVAPEKTISSTLGHGVSGAVLGRVGRIPALELGGYEFADVVVTFPVEEHQHPGGMDSRNGNLGSGILKRFNVTFDYKHERMLLQPNKAYAEPFEWDMSGMRFRPVEGGLVIYDLVDGSPAAEAGLSVDDVVTHIDGMPASSENMFELRNKLMRNGSKATIRAMRDGKPVEVQLTLRRLV